MSAAVIAAGFVVHCPTVDAGAAVPTGRPARNAATARALGIGQRRTLAEHLAARQRDEDAFGRECREDLADWALVNRVRDCAWQDAQLAWKTAAPSGVCAAAGAASTPATSSNVMRADTGLIGSMLRD